MNLGPDETYRHKKDEINRHLGFDKEEVAVFLNIFDRMCTSPNFLQKNI